VDETVSVEIPPTLQWAGSAVPRSVWRTEASVVRTARREGAQVVAWTSVERPNRARTPATDAAAGEFLAAQATQGIDAVLFAGLSSLKRLRKADDVAPADRAALEMLVWYANDEPERAGRALRKALPDVGFDALVDAIRRFGDPADLRPWQGLAAQEGLGDARRIELAEAIERSGGRATALAMARELAGSVDPDVKIRSRLLIERLQVEGDADWQDPNALLADDGSNDPRLALRRAELRLGAGDGPGAKAALTPLLGADLVNHALLEALLAHADARTGVTADRVRREVAGAVESAPSDPDVVAAGGDALAATGDAEGALEYALNAARLADHDPDRWSRVVTLALAAGELVPAVDAAHRASDLVPDNAAIAKRWAELAYALGDKAQVDAARSRAGMDPVADWPPPIDLRLAVDPAVVLAVLTHDDDAVTASPRLLGVRAQLRLDAGLLDEAAADGLTLALRHQDGQGWVMAFAATAGRQYWSRARQALDALAKTDLVAASTRMEYRLIAANADPLEDARRLAADDPRARSVVDLATTPSKAAAATPGWPTGATAPKAPSLPGFVANRVLSSIPGASAVSNPSAGVAVVLVGATTGVLPPPFASLYPDPPQPVLTLDRGGQVLRLLGGSLPLYAAVAPTEGREVWTFAFTPSEAVRALTLALPEPKPAPAPAPEPEPAPAPAAANTPPADAPPPDLRDQR
jgi:tetratricopeptide (TPR) repeat protein